MAEGVRIFILSVTRDLGDAVGGELAEAVTESGHLLAGRDMVLTEGDVGPALARRLADPKVQVALVCGAASRWGSDAGSRAVAAKVARPLEGLGALYRGLALEARGASVLLDEVAGGLTEGKKAVFSLPDDAAAAGLAARRLILPIVSDLLGRADKALAAEEEEAPEKATKAEKPTKVEKPASNEEAAPVPEGLSVSQILAAPPKEDKEELATGWEAGIRAMKGELRKSWPSVPDAFERLAASRDVLDGAGQRAEVVNGEGRRFGAFGYPDLNRVDARVLLVAEGEPVPEVIALHRHPRAVGTVTEGGALNLPTRDATALAERITGRAAPGGGDLFAVEGDAVYLLRDRKVVRWDGKREQDQGTVSQALASLMLRWTQR